MARALILHNPEARNAPEPSFMARIARELNWVGLRPETTASRHRGELVTLAREAARDGYDRVVVCGGDGSVREAAEGLRGTGVPLAVVPLGTINVLAWEMGLPVGRPGSCVEVAARGKPRAVGLGSVNGSAFTFCASAGVDSLAVAGVDLLMKKQTGGWAYVHAGITTLLERRPPLLQVTLSSGRVLHACQVFAARARLYGGRLILADSARLEASTLMLLAIAPPFFPNVPRAMARLMGSGIEDAPGVTSLAVEGFSLESDGPCPFQADGDAMGQTPASFRSEPGALTLVFPC